MKKLYLVDVSAYLFRSYFALPPMSNAKGEATHAVFGFAKSMIKLIKDFSPTHIAAVFDGPDNKRSRTELYADYKAHRKPIPEDLPHQIDRARELCKLLGLAVVDVEGVEADDAIGTIATHASEEDTHVYLCTSDKDCGQLVSENISMLNTFKDNLVIDSAKIKEIHGVRPDQMIDLLAIMGDTADNIPGLPGFGPKTASALLQEYGTLDQILAHPEKVKGQKKQETLKEHKELALLSRRLATIHTDVDCPIDLEAFTRRPPKQDELAQFYKDMGFNSLLRETIAPVTQSIPQVPLDYHTIDDLDQLKSVIGQISAHPNVCFDTETTSEDPMRAELVGIGFCFGEGTAYYLPCNGRLGRDVVLEHLKPLFEGSDVSFFGHNVKYDLHVLANYDIQVRKVGFDTILASYILNSHSHRHSLDHLVLNLFDKAKTPIKTLIGSGKKQITMWDVPIEQASSYCCEDVDYTWRLRQVLEPQLQQRGLSNLLFDLELPLMEVLLKMERTGIYLDVEMLKKMSVTITSHIAKLENEIFDLAGHPFNMQSPKQLSHILFEEMGIRPLKKTTTGFSTAAEVLEELAITYPIASKILEFRSLDKLRSTYIDTLPLQVHPTTHRIHCTFNQSVAATGRLSSQDPNLQNIPVRTEDGRAIRAAFQPATEGYVFLSADYSQIELRLMAHMSGDASLIEAFNKGEDIHAYTASLVFGVPLDMVSKDQRRQAKAVNFGIIYGQQAFGLSRELGIRIQDAALFIETYLSRYPKVRAFVEECKEKARSTGKAVTMIGRERLLPEINSSNGMQRTSAERLSVNAPLQGSAADLIKLAMLRVDNYLKNSTLKTKMLLQIHDELLFEVPEDEIDEVSHMVRTEMEGVFTLSVPLVVDVHIGKNWKEC